MYRSRLLQKWIWFISVNQFLFLDLLFARNSLYVIWFTVSIVQLCIPAARALLCSSFHTSFRIENMTCDFLRLHVSSAVITHICLSWVVQDQMRVWNSTASAAHVFILHFLRIYTLQIVVVVRDMSPLFKKCFFLFFPFSGIVETVASVVAVLDTCIPPQQKVSIVVFPSDAKYLFIAQDRIRHTSSLSVVSQITACTFQWASMFSGAYRIIRGFIESQRVVKVFCINCRYI